MKKKFVPILFALILILLMQCKTNITEPVEKELPDEESEILQVKFNGKVFDFQNDTLHVIPCDSMKLQIKIADKDKIKEYYVPKIYNADDSVGYEINESDTVTLQINLNADWNLVSNDTKDYHIGYRDNLDHYYKINLKLKVDPYVVFRHYCSQCFGECPSYEVLIFSDRTVKYTGYGNVVVKGIIYSIISTENYLKIIEFFNEKEFLKLDIQAGFGCTDAPIHSVMFNFKCERNYCSWDFCTSDEKLQTLKDCEALIDSLTNSKQWIYGTP